jgi:hypothetical protein
MVYNPQQASHHCTMRSTAAVAVPVEDAMVGECTGLTSLQMSLLKCVKEQSKEIPCNLHFMVLALDFVMFR